MEARSLESSKPARAGIELAATELTATHVRRRLQQLDDGAARGENVERKLEEADGNESGESKDEEGDKKSEKEDEDGDEASESKDEEGDSNGGSEDEEEEAKGGKASESEDEDDGKKEKEEGSNDAKASESGDEESGKKGGNSSDEGGNEKAVPVSEGDESSDEDEPEIEWPPSFFEMKDYSLETISMTSCQKIDFAVAYLTSLEFDGSVVTKNKNKKDNSKFWSDIYIIEMFVLPTSAILTFFGSSLLLPASMLTAAGFGTFLVFHFVSGVFGGLDCKIKLGLSAVSAGVCAALAKRFVRFGLFTLGAFSSGLATYLFFDAFPAFDPGQNFFDTQGLVSDASYLSSVMKHSDISQAAWAITTVIALFTGICIRVYEQASVEVLTALLGGTGVGYAVHAHILVHGGSLPRSMVFVIAALVGVLGKLI